MSLQIWILVILFSLIVLVGATLYIYFIFLKDPPPKSGYIYNESIDDFSRLEGLLISADAEAGVPLIAHYPYKEVNGFRDGLGYYGVSSQERGFVLGISGSGKTTYLVAQLVEWMKSGKSFVATDVKPEIWAILRANGAFEYFGYDDIVINPTDPLAFKYNALDDIDDAEFAMEVIELVEILVGDIEFGDGAKMLLRAVLLHLKASGDDVSLHHARAYFTRFDDADELIDDLRRSDSKLTKEIISDFRKIASNERFVGSVFGAVSRTLRFLDNEVIASSISKSDVSLRSELRERKKAVFLQFEQGYKEQTEKLYGYTLAHVLRLLQSNHVLNGDVRPDVFIALDEIINASRIPNLEQKLNVIRSYGMPLFMYLQTTSGLNNVYGKDADKLFMSACSLKICYRVNDSETAEVFSDMIGITEVGSWSTTETPEVRQDGKTIVKRTRSQHNVDKPLVEPTELLQLETGKAIVIIDGKSARLTMPRYYADYPAMTHRPAFGNPSQLKQLQDLESEAETETEAIL